ncbi:hypothetical protein [Bordetella sp. LUAb4]|uniref:DUF2167 domain-containing protein n=1 Tax=Bordetella sp. LUAb4 TaxID=2843195 RepID=UPI001E623037|nr:hypothetical protein [Bordetella sp. LUAb4]
MHRYKKIASCWIAFGLLVSTYFAAPAATLPASCFGALYDGGHSQEDIDALICAPWKSGMQTLGPGIRLQLPDSYAYLTPQDATSIATRLTSMPLQRAGRVTRCGAPWLMQVDVAYFADVDTSALAASIHPDDLLEALEQHKVVSTRNPVNFDSSSLAWLTPPSFDERTRTLRWAYHGEKMGHAEQMMFGDSWIVSFSVDAAASDIDAAQEALSLVAGQVLVDKKQVDKIAAGDIRILAEQVILPSGHALHIPEEAAGVSRSTAEILVLVSLGLALILVFVRVVSRRSDTPARTENKAEALRSLIDKYRSKAPVEVSYDDPLTRQKAKSNAPLEFLLPLIPFTAFKNAFKNSEFFVLVSKSSGKPECLALKDDGETANFVTSLEPASFVEKSMATPALLLAETMRGVKRDEALPNDQTFICLFGHQLARHLPPEGRAMHIVLKSRDVMVGGKPMSTSEIISLDAAFVRKLFDCQGR